jgi:diadenylate cyclase
VRSFLERIGERPGLALIELILIGGVVYTVLRFLQGTRGARLVRAVMIILVGSFALVYLIAEQLELDRINVLYPYFILGVFLVSLVAFQTELRRMLLRLGQAGWLERWFKGSAAVVDPLATAVQRLAKKKIGALIAIQRGTEVGALIETGVRLDALVTTELIETIFWPGTPLHDLGVVLHQDRIIAAGCQFPLAESGDVDRSLGSRHRAALGLSQEADAVVIVVSEETGTVSLAIGGRLRRALTPEALRATLIKELSPKPPETGGKKAAARVPTPPAEAAKDGTGQAA